MTEVALGAVLGLIAGVLVACVYLVFKPVSQVKEMPPEDKIQKSMVYFIPGNESNAKSRGWQAKQKQILGSPTFTLDLVEDELNAWANTLAAPAAPGVDDDLRRRLARVHGRERQIEPRRAAADIGGGLGGDDKGFEIGHRFAQRMNET